MNLLRRLLPGIALVMGAFLLSIGLQTLAAWTPPGGSPPSSNAYAPLNTGPDAQTKTGNVTSSGTVTGATVSGTTNLCIAGTCRSSWPAGTVTSVATNNGLTGGTINTSGTIGLNTTGNLLTCTNSTTNKLYWNGSALACGTDQTGAGGITSINTMTGPAISIAAGSGISVSNSANSVTITNTAGGGGLSGSGSTNYVSKWIGGTALGNSQIYDNGTSVGIGSGMSSPWAQLDVGGRVGINGPAFRAMDSTFSKHVFIVPYLGAGGYNGMSYSGDSGIFSAQNTGLVIGPWNASGGIRIHPGGDIHLGPGLFVNTGGYAYLNSTINTQDVWLRNAGRWASSGGCNWSGWKCSCGADIGGGAEVTVVTALYCSSGILTDFSHKYVHASGGTSCPAVANPAWGCSSYNYSNF